MIEMVREYFAEKYSHVDLSTVSDSVISEFMSLTYLNELTFREKMDCYCDFIVANGIEGVY